MGKFFCMKTRDDRNSLGEWGKAGAFRLGFGAVIQTIAETPLLSPWSTKNHCHFERIPRQREE